MNTIPAKMLVVVLAFITLSFLYFLFDTNMVQNKILAYINYLEQNGYTVSAEGEGFLISGQTTIITNDNPALRIVFDGNTQEGLLGRGIVATANDTTGHSSHVTTQKSHGTYDEPLTLGAGEGIGAFATEGYDGSDYVSTGNIVWMVDSLASSGHISTWAYLDVENDGSSVTVQTWNSDGTVLFNSAIILPNNKAIQEKTLAGVAQNILYMSSGDEIQLDSPVGTLRIDQSIAQDISVWGTSSGTGRVFYIKANNAASGAGTTASSPTVSLLATYRNGSDTLTAWQATIAHDMETGGAAPLSDLRFNINGVAIMSLRNNNGTSGVYLNIPSSDPNVAGMLYYDSGSGGVKRSAGGS